MAETSRSPAAVEVVLDKVSKYMLKQRGRDTMLILMTRLLGDTSLSDFSIICGDRDWKVHKFMLALHSPVLQAACTQGFKVLSSHNDTATHAFMLTLHQEAHENKIDLSEEGPACVGAFVYYMYNLNYDAAHFADKENYLSLHVQLCIIADKYDMKLLQSLAVDKFRSQVEASAPSESDIATAASCAYDAMGPTTEIRKMIVEQALTRKLIPTEISEEPATEFEKTMHMFPGLCIDMYKSQQKVVGQREEEAKAYQEKINKLQGEASAHYQQISKLQAESAAAQKLLSPKRQFSPPSSCQCSGCRRLV